MSQENVEIVRQFYDCLARRDWDGMWQDMDPDFVLDTQLQGSYRGRDECQAFIEDQINAFESWKTEPGKMLERDDRVAVVATVRVRPRGTSAEIEIHTGHLFMLCDRHILRLQTFPQPAKAFEAAGLGD